MQKIKTKPLEFSGNAGYWQTVVAAENPLYDYVIMDGYADNGERFALCLDNGLDLETIGIYGTEEEAMNAANEHFNKLINEIIKNITWESEKK